MVSLPPLRGGTGLLSAALRAATAFLSYFFIYLIFAPFGREREILLESARGLRAPGPCAYFWPAPKVGKNALKPTV